MSISAPLGRKLIISQVPPGASWSTWVRFRQSAATGPVHSSHRVGDHGCDDACRDADQYGIVAGPNVAIATRRRPETTMPAIVDLGVAGGVARVEALPTPPFPVAFRLLDMALPEIASASRPASDLLDVPLPRAIAITGPMLLSLGRYGREENGRCQNGTHGVAQHRRSILSDQKRTPTPATIWCRSVSTSSWPVEPPSAYL